MVEVEWLMVIMVLVVGSTLGEKGYYSPKFGYVHPDVGLDVVELIKKYNYPIETHHVETEDGYILSLHRIPHGKFPNATKEPKKVVLLTPCILCSSSVWVHVGPKNSLGYLLADRGYDVWMVNSRGTTHARRHVKWNPDVDRKQFWNYSYHEMGVYDLPATIDYILDRTNQDQLHYVGFSQGTTVFFVLASERPEYNSKIKLATLLAPFAYGAYMPSPVIRFFVDFQKQIEAFSEASGIYEFLPRSVMLSTIGQIFCNKKAPTQEFCVSAIGLMCGFNFEQFNREMFPVILSNTPAGASAKQILHFLQGIKQDRFGQYDYGKYRNKIVYGSSTPPDYNISKISTPVALYAGPNDWISDPKDVEQLQKLLPKVALLKWVDGFSHLDFFSANDLQTLINIPIVDFMDLS